MTEAELFNITEPEIRKDEILTVHDPYFTRRNVAVVTGASSGVGRPIAVALAANGLLVLGADVDAERGRETIEIARSVGGEMVFQKADLTRDEDIVNCANRARELGSVKFLANIAGIQHIDPIENFPMEM